MTFIREIDESKFLQINVLALPNYQKYLTTKIFDTLLEEGKEIITLPLPEAIQKNSDVREGFIAYIISIGSELNDIEYYTKNESRLKGVMYAFKVFENYEALINLKLGSWFDVLPDVLVIMILNKVRLQFFPIVFKKGEMYHIYNVHGGGPKLFLNDVPIILNYPEIVNKQFRSLSEHDYLIKSLWEKYGRYSYFMYELGIYLGKQGGVEQYYPASEIMIMNEDVYFINKNRQNKSFDPISSQLLKMGAFKFSKIGEYYLSSS